MTAPIRTVDDIVVAWRQRIHELGLTHQTVDAIAGWAEGWTGKIMCGTKAPGAKTIETMNAALGLAFIPTEDPEAAAKVGRRWVRRVRPRSAEDTLSITLSIEKGEQKMLQLQAKTKKREFMKSIGKKGGKRRLKTMKKRARQRIASHAARKRWSNRKRPKER